MADIVERLRFDSARCEMQFSKGVAGNIEEAAAEIKRLRALLVESDRLADGYYRLMCEAGDKNVRLRIAGRRLESAAQDVYLPEEPDAAMWQELRDAAQAMRIACGDEQSTEGK